MTRSGSALTSDMGVDSSVDLADATAAGVGEFLAGLTWSTHGSRTHVLPAGTAVSLTSDRASLVYVMRGAVSVVRPVTSTPVAVDPFDQPLATGDFLLALGRQPLALRGATAAVGAETPEDPEDGTAHVVVVRVDPSDPTRLDLLPDAFTVRDFLRTEPAVARLAASMGCPNQEHASNRSRDIICAHIATTVVTTAITTWVERGCAPQGWLNRVSDPDLARVLDAMHAAPATAWTLAHLARVAAMSRTVFSERFRTVVGTSPAHYLAHLRMELAKQHLAREGRTVGETSRLLGYATEDGFSRAFRRHTGASPSAWRQAQSVA